MARPNDDGFPPLLRLLSRVLDCDHRTLRAIRLIFSAAIAASIPAAPVLIPMSMMFDIRNGVNTGTLALTARILTHLRRSRPRPCYGCFNYVTARIEGQPCSVTLNRHPEPSRG